MKVILLQDIPKIGKKYEIKNIADGFALNFLIPKKLAQTATNNIIKDVEKKREILEEKEDARKKDLIKNINKMKDSSINIEAKASDGGGLFASINKENIISAIRDQKALEIDENFIILEHPIKKIGENIIEIKVNGESTKFKLNILPLPKK